MTKRYPASAPKSTAAWTGYLLHWVHRKLEAAYSQAMGDLHLSLQQVSILQLLQDEGTMTQAAIVDALALDKGAASREVRNLEEQQLLSRARSGTGRREVVVELREKGRARLTAIEQRNQRVTERVFSALSPHEVQALHELLTCIAETEIE